ncbi:efflux RND transporter permease subunit [Candidatus Fermentibacteria bacterium]|nr:efflux RND transporter permease subunit [Candidatus Fermentibacteria bacterium]
MIIQAAVDRPVTIIMVFAGLVLMGVLALQRLPVDLLPAINYPNLTVITTYPDTPPEDVARLVTQPLEEVITGLAGVRRVTSRTREGVSTITVEYEWGREMNFANLHLREALDRVAFRDDFPEGADRPLILRWDPGARPVAILALGGGQPLSETTDFARDVAKPALEQIQGVSQAEVIGGVDREIVVRPDLGKLRLFGLSMEELRAAIQIANVSFPGGRIRRGALHLPLRIHGEFENLDDIRLTEIPGRGGMTIGDVAAVADTLREPEGLTLLGENEVVSLHLYKEVGANTVTVTKEVDRILAILSEQYPGFSSVFVYRDDSFVKESFRGLRDSLAYGALLAFAVLFFFLRDLRSPLVVGVAIPVSVFTTFAFLYFAKVNLNLMSLGGLSLAAGMLVDNSIVVLENITRFLRARREEPGESRAAAVRGASEVASPVVAATLTTVAVFFPVIYVPGIAGEFFRDQALTVSFALLVSIASALLLQPMLAARFLSSAASHPRGIFSGAERLFETIADRYHRLLERTLDRKGRFIAVLAVMALASIAVGLGLRTSFLPERNQGDFTLALEMPSGAPLEETAAVSRELCRAIGALNEVATVYAQVGQTERTVAALKEYTAATTARIRVLLHPARDSRRRSETVRANIAALLAEVPGVSSSFRDEGIGLREILAGSGAPFALGVVAERPEDAAAVAIDLTQRLREVKGLTDIETDRVLGSPTLEVTVDRESALRHGLEPAALARELRARIQGTVASTFNEVEQRVDIAVRLPEQERRSLDAVLASSIRLRGDVGVPLGSFVTVKETRPVREVVRHNQRRQVTIHGNVQGRSSAAVWRAVKPLLSEVSLPPGAAFITGGEQEEIRGSFRDLGWALLLSAVLVYMILAAQFESFLDPLIMAAVLPVGLMGGVLTLRITGQSLNVISLIGFIALLGIAVNDAIVKVATIRRLRQVGYAGRAAILEASRLRLRPIVMTTVTTVLAMVPMAIGIGSGEQIQRPLALTIIGGLTLATALTLFLVPVLYEAIHRRRDDRYDGTPASETPSPDAA